MDLKVTHLAQPSEISAETIQAYLETEYRVQGAPGFVLRVGQPNQVLLAAHRQQGVQCSAYLTACNPYSIQNDEFTNSACQAALEEIVLQRGLKLVSGIGQHPSNEWPGEESFLIFGLTLEDASNLGRQFGQNAFIWNGEDANPQLILLR